MLIYGESKYCHMLFRGEFAIVSGRICHSFGENLPHLNLQLVKIYSNRRWGILRILRKKKRARAREERASGADRCASDAP